jgi:hypothetical protein
MHESVRAINQASTNERLTMNIATAEFIERKSTVTAHIRKPYASEVASDIMNKQVSDYDYMDWSSMTDSDIVEAFGEVLGTIATYKPDPSIGLMANRCERLAQIEERIEGFLKAWAIREGYPE